MSFENIGSIEGFVLLWSTTAETANHCTLVMGQCMPVFVVFASKSLDMILATLDWAFFRSLSLMREHVSLEILENPSAIRPWACTLVLG